MRSPKRIILIAIFISVILMLVKFLAYFLTASNVILTDAAESIVNVVASCFAYYSIHLSSIPRDKNHPYGHGKVEFFAVGIEGILILIAGILIIIKSGYSVFQHHHITNLGTGIILVAITGLVNFVLGYMLIQSGKKNNSITLEADGKHLMTDAYSSAGVIGGLVIIKLTGIVIIDSILSIIIGIYVIYSGYKLVRKFVAGLMDESDFKLVDKVVHILNINRRDEWIDIHNLRVQQYGPDMHIDCHLTMPYYFELSQSHEQVRAVEDLIRSEIGANVEHFIHVDPCLPECCHYCRMKNCPVRTEPFSKEVDWTIDILMENQKHF
ncbi:cation diffusion facilitator family transporter [Solitalea koreensis]|uniref:cation diffusion facilitator family transporter n=1 Tax=Solitalea koreensis TaxID=543615 RepID=UPI001159E2C5|nr:cation diffusion facilitator family transporter [Solitalea koreensis]